MDDIPGNYIEKIDFLKGLGAEGIEGLTKKAGAFKVKVAAGDAVCIPPGFLIAEVSPTCSSFVRWGFLKNCRSAWKEASAVLSGFLDAFTAARSGSLVSWEQHLAALLAADD